jgi:dihydrofolate synthase / folylpolyglutamate synthase
MQAFRSFADVHTYLNSHLPQAWPSGHAYTLDRMRSLMDYLGNPQDTYKTIHIAGTSGKTSTSYYAASLLRQAGFKVGLTVSPHVDEVNERVQINNKSFSELRFCSNFTTFIERVSKSGIKPTYFELLVAFAFWSFKQAKVDYAVVEVGLGGLLDATNVMHRQDKLCVITDIDYDHTSSLGKTLEAIAAQKAGIIQPHTTVFVYEQDEAVMQVLQEVAEQQHAELHEVWPLKDGELPQNLPLFQRRNWYLAYAACEYLAKRDTFAMPSEVGLEKTTLTYVPARMEEVELAGHMVVMDGAHNPQKFRTLMKSIKHAHQTESMACMVSFVRTKQSKVRDSLRALVPYCSHLIITSFAHDNTGKTSIDPLKIAEQCADLGFEKWEVIPDPLQAYRQLIKRPEDILLVTGSFFLLNYVRPYIREKT